MFSSPFSNRPVASLTAAKVEQLARIVARSPCLQSHVENADTAFQYAVHDARIARMDQQMSRPAKSATTVTVTVDDEDDATEDVIVTDEPSDLTNEDLAEALTAEEIESVSEGGTVTTSIGGQRYHVQRQPPERCEVTDYIQAAMRAAAMNA